MLRVIGVSKKHNSIWRVYGYDYNEDDNLVLIAKKNQSVVSLVLQTEKTKTL